MFNSYYPTSTVVTYPITLAEAKDYLEIPSTDTRHDSKLNTLISAATSKAEEFTGNFFIQRQVVFNMNSFTENIRFPINPFISIDNIKYYSNGILETLDPSKYESDVKAFPPFVKVISIPSTDTITNAVQINVTAGYSDVASIPDNIKMSLLFLVYQSFTKRDGEEDQTNTTMQNLLTPYKQLKI